MIDWRNISLKNFAGFVSQELKNRGVNTILVGGACVTIYSRNRYQSYDLDFITYDDMKYVKKVLIELGFKEKRKYYYRDDCSWLIEFVSPPVAIGNEPVHEFNNIETPLGTIKLLHVEDSVKDRLASFFHWDDKQGLLQAIDICLEQEVDLKKIEKWAKKENELEKFLQFKKTLGTHL